MTLMSTLHELDAGGFTGPQRGRSSPLVDSQEPETVQQGGLCPSLEDWRRRGQDQGSPSPPVEDWRGWSQDPGGPSPPGDGCRGRSQDEGGLGVRLRQAGLTPPSLLKRSASLAKLDHLQLSTFDLSDLDARSGGGSGGMEPR